MKLRAQANSRYAHNAGAALLIAIFALLLISVVAIAMIVSTGTDSALAGNYRTATGAYYASVAGLEEARGRLLWKNPNFINQSGSYTNVLFDASGTLPDWGLLNVVYIINPAPGETVDPAAFNGPNAATYPDTEYGNEFSWGLGGANVLPYITSVSSTSGLSPGPRYKWVRINAVSEQSIKIDVNGNSIPDPYIVYYDPAYSSVSAPNTTVPSLLTSSLGFPASIAQPLTPPNPPPPPSSTSVQVLEITALAVFPGGATRLLQYLVAPVMVSPSMSTPDAITNLNFPGALTLDGNSVNFVPPGPGADSYQISGLDVFGASGSFIDGCPTAVQPGGIASLAYTNSSDGSNIASVATPAARYPGYPPPPPPPAIPSSALLNATLRQSWMAPSSLDSVAQDITNNADVIIQGPATGSSIFSKTGTMQPSNPMTVVVNGDLNLNGTNTGYGLLLVTGNMSFDPDATWNGIVMVVGQGTFTQTKGGSGGIIGTLFLAKTRDSSGNLLSNSSGLGAASYTVSNSRPGFGICYNSGSVKSAQGPLTYKVLSFHEIPTS